MGESIVAHFPSAAAPFMTPRFVEGNRENKKARVEKRRRQMSSLDSAPSSDALHAVAQGRRKKNANLGDFGGGRDGGIFVLSCISERKKNSILKEWKKRLWFGSITRNSQVYVCMDHFPSHHNISWHLEILVYFTAQ